MWFEQHPGDPKQWNKPSPKLNRLANIAIICTVIGSYVAGAYFRKAPTAPSETAIQFLGPLAHLTSLRTPLKVDEITKIVRVERIENEVRYIIELSIPKDELYEQNKEKFKEALLGDSSFKRKILSQECPRLRGLGIFEAEGILNLIYIEPKGASVGAIEVSENSCKKYGA